MAGTFVIGVGGTGLKTLIHVKKQLQDSRPDGKLPSDVQILGIDTRSEPETISGIGSWHNAQARKQLKEYKGDVSIDRNMEYYWLGGNLEKWTCGDISQGEKGLDDKEYITRWFDLQYFSNNPQRSALLSIKDGAGMFRQIGRLGLFYHLQNGQASLLYTRLSQKLSAIADTDITAILVGSLAGGTGASLFQDIAYLVKAIGEQNGKSVKVTAMLVLPEAFNWTPNLVVDPTMRARSVAAMREMVRFKTVNESALGFRMQYVDGNHPVLSSQAKGALFSMVYLLEKRAKLPQHPDITNPLDTTIDFGMSPTIASWIAALCAHTIATQYNAWSANMAALESANDFQGLVPAYCSSFGTYSFVLPLASIIEKWTSDLALDVLAHLIPLTPSGEFDPANVGETLVTAGKVRAGENWSTNPSHVARDAGNLGQREDPKTHAAIVKEVSDRIVQDWRSQYLDQNSPDAWSKIFEEMVENKKYYYNHWRKWPITPIDEGALVKRKAAGNYDRSPEKAAAALHDACEQKYGEMEGEWNKTLNEIVEYQLQVFKEQSQQFANDVLNGQDRKDGPMQNTQQDPILNRMGSLTWLLSYVNQQTSDLTKALAILDDAARGFEDAITNIESDWITGTKNKNPLLQQMKRDESKQADYLKARQDWLFAKRKLLLCSKEKELVKKMLNWCSYLAKRLNDFAVVMSTNINSMVKWIGRRKEDIVQEEDSAIQLNRVREIVNDPVWENLKYQEYFCPDPNQPNIRSQVLQNISWNVREITVGASTTTQYQAPEPELKILGFSLEPEGGYLASNKITTQYFNTQNTEALKDEVKHNSLRLLEICRKQFAGVWDSLTVVDYLKYHYNGDQADLTAQGLAATAAKKCNILLGTSATDPIVSMAYVIVPASMRTDGFIGQVLNQLRVEVNAAAQFNEALPNDDPTTLTFLVLNSGFTIKSLDAYKTAAQNYLQISPVAQGAAQSRRLHHIFRAEQEATRYDRMNPDRSTFMVSNRVSMPLEEPELLDRFLTSLAVGLIQYEQVPITQQSAGYVFKASIQKIENVFGSPQIVFDNYLLNKPNPDGVGYLEAVECFCLRSLDHSVLSKPLQDLHSMLEKAIPGAVEKKLETEYLSRWQQGGNGCTARQIAAVRDNNPSTRPVKLRMEATKQLWRSIAPDIKARRDAILSMDKSALAQSKTLPDELEFLNILLSRIQEYTQE